MLASVEIIENPKESIDRAYDISISARDELLLKKLPTMRFVNAASKQDKNKFRKRQEG